MIGELVFGSQGSLGASDWMASCSSCSPVRSGRRVGGWQYFINEVVRSKFYKQGDLGKYALRHASSLTSWFLRHASSLASCFLRDASLSGSFAEVGKPNNVATRFCAFHGIAVLCFPWNGGLDAFSGRYMNAKFQILV